LSNRIELRRTVGVIGLGHVGGSVCELFADHVRLVTWDRTDDRPYPDAALASCDFVVVCVDTPPTADGSADVSSVVQATARLPCDRVLLKSTVPPGTTTRLVQSTGKRICYWPEYVGESRYHNPFFSSKIEEVPFVILGGEPADRRWFIDRLLPVLGPTKTYFQCDAVEAELIKYAENAYFAAKITFVNEFRRICEAFSADWHTVREGWLLDPRVEPMHTAAFEDDPGFEGKCLPKDVRAIIAAAEDRGYTASFLAQVLATNATIREGLTGDDAIQGAAVDL
jgi:UDPglucose 6-dehydrogenase